MHSADLLAGCAFPSKQRLFGRDVAATQQAGNTKPLLALHLQAGIVTSAD